MDELDNISLGLQPETWLEPMLPGLDRFRFPDQRACLRARTLPSFSRSMYLQTHINCWSRVGDCANRDYVYSGLRVTCKVLSSNAARRFNYDPVPEILSLQRYVECDGFEALACGSPIIADRL